MEKSTVIKAGIGAVALVVCLIGYIFSRKKISSEELTKKQKLIKRLWFAGLIISIWFLVGVFISGFSGLENKLEIKFEMFSPRVNVFGFSLAQTTIISVCVTAVLILLAVIFRIFAVPRFKTEGEPGSFQSAVEAAVEAIDNLCINAVGEQTAKNMAPYMLSICIFMIGCAMTELLGLRAPTSDLTCTIGMGLCTFILLNYYGIKKHGVLGRLKSMGGTVPAMRPIMIPLKAVSDIAVPVSLGCRLFGNMMGGMLVMELLKSVLGGYASGIPAIAGLYFNLFHPLIQMYIFVMLSLTFINEAQE